MSPIIERTPSPHSDSPEPGPSDAAVNGARKFRKVTSTRRTDSGKLHRVRHGMLSRDALSALVRIGEDARTLRRLERQYRAVLWSPGPLFSFFFDLFWSSYLRPHTRRPSSNGISRG